MYIGMKNIYGNFVCKIMSTKYSPSVRNNCQDLSVLQSVVA